jgi:uncharacterized protein DUF3300
MRGIAALTGFAFLLAMQGVSLAQDAQDAPAEPDAAQAQSSGQDASAGQQDQQPLLDEGQLDQLVAPIALYPDPLLAQVLIASTYPLEVVQAERWLEKNKELKGEALDEALAKEDWDDSIKALVEVPDVLSMMNEDLDWTSKLGDAVLAQQAGVMDAVQRLRALAHENGKLESNDQQTVTVKQEVNVEQAPAESQAPAGAPPAPQQVIVIEPTSPETVYVPYYQPSVVYGGWPYPDYPPYYFEPRPGYIVGGAIATGLAWSAGFAIGNAIWGDGFDWHDDNIHVNVNRNVNINNNNINVANWQHDAYHRRGVNYNDTDVRNKFSNTNLGDKKNDFRGRADGLPDRAGDKRPSVGDLESALKDKPGLGDKRPGGGGLAGNKPNLGDKRPSAGDLQGALKDKKPGGGALADKKSDLAKKPDIKKPNIADKKPNLAAKTPDIKKPDIKKPDIKKPPVKRPSGNAFDKRDGAKAKSYSNRGKASVGNRSAKNLHARGGGGRGGGGHRGGGGRRR